MQIAIVISLFALALLQSSVNALKVSLTAIPRSRFSPHSHRRVSTSFDHSRRSHFNVGALNRRDSAPSAGSDMIYAAPITIGANTYQVELDTGSSDFWVIPNTADQASFKAVPDMQSQLLTYGNQFASGTLSTAAVTFDGFKIDSQAILAASNVNSPIMSANLSGILGCGFPYMSKFAPLLESKGAGTGNPLLINIMNQNFTASDNRFFSIALARLEMSSIPKSAGTFTLGEYDPAYKFNASTPPIPVLTPKDKTPVLWTVEVNGFIGNDGKAIPVGSTIYSGMNSSAVALLRTGSILSYASNDTIKALYATAGAASQAQWVASESMYYLPCNVAFSMSVLVNKVAYPIHPLDIITSHTLPGNPNMCRGGFQPVDFEMTYYDIVLGNVFLKNVYAVFNYGGTNSAFVKLQALTNQTGAITEFTALRSNSGSSTVGAVGTYTCACAPGAISSGQAMPSSSAVRLSSAVPIVANSSSVAAPVVKRAQTYTMADVAKHNKAGDLWIVIKGKVYDVTSFDHPGGASRILDNAGKDGTTPFTDEAAHADVDPEAQDGVKLLGTIGTAAAPATSSSTSADPTTKAAAPAPAPAPATSTSTSTSAPPVTSSSTTPAPIVPVSTSSSALSSSTAPASAISSSGGQVSATNSANTCLCTAASLGGAAVSGVVSPEGSASGASSASASGASSASASGASSASASGTSSASAASASNSVSASSQASTFASVSASNKSSAAAMSASSIAGSSSSQPAVSSSATYTPASSAQAVSKPVGTAVICAIALFLPLWGAGMLTLS